MNTEQRITELEKVVKEQQTFIESLKFSHSIPLDLDQSFRERFINNSPFLLPSGLGSVGSDLVYNAFNVIVPAKASGTLKVPYNGTTYELLYK
jgi:hypothetical protein